VVVVGAAVVGGTVGGLVVGLVGGGAVGWPGIGDGSPISEYLPVGTAQPVASSAAATTAAPTGAPTGPRRRSVRGAEGGVTWLRSQKTDPEAWTLAAVGSGIGRITTKEQELPACCRTTLCGRKDETMMVEILKVSSKSSPNAVAGALAGVVRRSGAVEMQVVGAGALNQAVKAIAIARGYLEASDIDLVCVPTFADIEIAGEGRTAVRLLCEDRLAGGRPEPIDLDGRPTPVTVDLRSLSERVPTSGG